MELLRSLEHEKHSFIARLFRHSRASQTALFSSEDQSDMPSRPHGSRTEHHGGTEHHGSTGSEEPSPPKGTTNSFVKAKISSEEWLKEGEETIRTITPVQPRMTETRPCTPRFQRLCHTAHVATSDYAFSLNVPCIQRPEAEPQQKRKNKSDYRNELCNGGKRSSKIAKYDEQTSVRRRLDRATLRPRGEPAPAGTERYTVSPTTLLKEFSLEPQTFSSPSSKTQPFIPLNHPRAPGRSEHRLAQGYSVPLLLLSLTALAACDAVSMYSSVQRALGGCCAEEAWQKRGTFQLHHHPLQKGSSCPFREGWGLNHFPGQPVPMLDNPFSEEKFPNIQSKPPLVQLEAISSRPITCYLGEETDPHLSTTSFQAVVESDKVSPQPPFLQAKQPQVPQPLPISLVLQTLPQLRCPSLDTLQPLNVSLGVGGPTLNTAFEVRPHQCRVQGHDHCPSPAGHTIFDTSQDAIGLLGHLGTLLAHIQAAVNQHPQVLLCQAAFQPLFPKPVALHGVVVTQVQDPALSLVEPHTIDLGPSIQPVQVPLQSLPPLQQINTPTQLGVICKLTEGALDPFIQIIDKDIKQNWPQHRALGNTACDRPPTGAVSYTNKIT
ncbi:hypothetical protein QYF61_012215 [Mycteria americana]|uniref:Uncharacterized protein n=1 Tax=Mycteria americana TaxID=33587 RepID=A0AAN7NSB6_MYCAM|nr:hypothetical protein QYF61_012215 [Mycteria americana]